MYYYRLISSMLKAPSVDADAQLFITNAVITDITQQNAINKLVTDFKAANIWTKMKAIYPFVGGTAAQHRFNLKDPRPLDSAYYLTFYNGWTHSSTGAKPNGTDGYADTKLAPTTAGMSANSFHMSNYSRTSFSSGTSRIYIGVRSLGLFNMTVLGWLSGGTQEAGTIAGTTDGTEYSPTPALSPSTAGMKLITTNTNRNARLYRGSTYQATQVLQTSSETTLNNIFIGAWNSDGTSGLFSNAETAFASIGSGLTDTDSANLNTAVATFNTTLSRNV